MLTIEERVARLEAEVAELKRRQPAESDSKSVPWWKRVVGAYKDDPDFLEAMRLGREYRESTVLEPGEPES